MRASWLRWAALPPLPPAAPLPWSLSSLLALQCHPLCAFLPAAHHRRWSNWSVGHRLVGRSRQHQGRSRSAAPRFSCAGPAGSRRGRCTQRLPLCPMPSRILSQMGRSRARRARQQRRQRGRRGAGASGARCSSLPLAGPRCTSLQRLLLLWQQLPRMTTTMAVRRPRRASASVASPRPCQRPSAGQQATCRRTRLRGPRQWSSTGAPPPRCGPACCCGGGRGPSPSGGRCTTPRSCCSRRRAQRCWRRPPPRRPLLPQLRGTPGSCWQA